MSKIGYTKVICACCKQTVQIKRIFSFSSDMVGLDGNRHNPLQYELEECPECHFTALDISDNGIQVTKEMLNAFHIKAGCDQIQTSEFTALLKAADIYEKNRKPLLQAYMLRLASFYAEEQMEISLSRNLLRMADTVLQTYFESIENMTLKDAATAIYLIDGNRRLGMKAAAIEMCDDLLLLLKELAESKDAADIRKILEFEKMLIENNDTKEHLTEEAM